jgi:hypothetical protein
MADLRGVYNFTGGINNSVSDEFIGENECSDARNFMPDYTGQGAIIKREGITKVSAEVTSYISSIFQGKNHNYMTVSASFVGYASSGVFHLDGTSIVAADYGAYPNWVTFTGYDIIATTTICKKTDDGANFTDVTNHPAGARLLAVANNFLYYAGHDGGTLGWHNAGTLTYSATNALVLTKNENDSIVELHPYGTGVFVLCNNSFYIVSGSSNLEHGVAYANRSTGGLAASGGRSVVTTAVGLFWLSNTGIVWLKPDMSLDYPTMRKIPKTISDAWLSSATQVHAINDPVQRKVIFYQAIGGGGGGIGTFTRIDYYYDTDRLYIHNGAGVQMSSSGYTITNGSFVPYVGGYKYLYSISGNTDDGTNIEAYAETKRESDPDILRINRKIILTTGLTTSAPVSYSCFVNNGTTADTTWKITPATGVVDTTIGVNRSCSKIKHRVADSSAYRGRIISLRPAVRTFRPV